MQAFSLPAKRSLGTSPPRGAMPAILSLVLVLMLLPTALLAPRADAQGTRTATTAAAAPVGSLAYIQIPLDERSEQWQLGRALIDRAGFGPMLDQALAEGLTDEHGNRLPLDAILGGEAGVVLSASLLSQAATETGLSTDMGDLSSLLGTPVATSDGTSGTQGVAVVLDARAPDTALAAMTAVVRDRAAENGTTAQTTDHAGVTITYAAVSGDGGSGMAVARVGDHLLLASDPADLAGPIEAASGTTPSLADAAPFQKARQVLGGDDLLFAFVNGPAAARAEGALGALGPAGGSLLHTERYTALQVKADQPGLRIETVAMSADGTPIADAAAPYVSALASKAPGDAAAFLSGMDLGKTGFLDALGAVGLQVMLGTTGLGPTPNATADPATQIAAQYASLAGLIGFNPQTDLIHQLSGEYGFWVGGLSDPSQIGVLFASGVSDPSTVGNVLSQITILAQGGAGSEGGVTTRTVGGSTVTTVPTGPGGPPLEFGLVGGQLVLAAGAGIDQFAAGGSRASLADNAKYQAVMSALPAESNGSLYLDLSQLLPLAEQAGQSGGGGLSEPAVKDDSPDCAKFSSQEEAQKAYDSLAAGTFDLDRNFNGVACEDFFATPASGGSEPAMAGIEGVDLSALKAFGLVAFDQDGMRRTSSILYVGEPGA